MTRRFMTHIRILSIARPLLTAVASLFLAVAAFAANYPEDQVERIVEKSFQLSGNQGLSLDNRFGNVHIVSGSGRELKVTATIRVQGKSREDAQSFSDKIQIDFQQAGDGIHVRTIYPDEHSAFVLRIQWKRTSYSVDYNVTLPIDSPLWLRNDFGNVELAGIHGWAHVENGHGRIDARDIGQSNITNAFGEIQLSNSSGDCIVIDNNGNVEATNVSGTLNIKDRFGNITVTQVKGAVAVSGGNGNIELSQVGANATISNGFGNVTAKNVRGSLTVHNANARVEATDIGGNADLTTSFGEVTAERIGGTLQVQDNNGQVVAREIHGVATIHTSFGQIDAANLHSNASLTTGNGSIEASNVAGDLFAKTSFGSVEVRDVKGSLTVQDANGAVTATKISGDATVDTSFAGVTLSSIGGKIRVENRNGSIEVTADQQAGCRDISLKTSFSHVTARIPSNSGYRVNAHTSFGKISSEMPITATGVIGSETLNGTIGNGACTLELANNNGNIEIEKSR